MKAGKNEYTGPIFVVQVIFEIDGIRGCEMFLMPETSKEWTNIFQAGQIWSELCRRAKVPAGALIHLKNLNMARVP